MAAALQNVVHAAANGVYILKYQVVVPAVAKRDESTPPQVYEGDWDKPNTHLYIFSGQFAQACLRHLQTHMMSHSDITFQSDRHLTTVRSGNALSASCFPAESMNLETQLALVTQAVDRHNVADQSNQQHIRFVLEVPTVTPHTLKVVETMCIPDPLWPGGASVVLQVNGEYVDTVNKTWSRDVFGERIPFECAKLSEVEVQTKLSYTVRVSRHVRPMAYHVLPDWVESVRFMHCDETATEYSRVGAQQCVAVQRGGTDLVATISCWGTYRSECECAVVANSVLKTAAAVGEIDSLADAIDLAADVVRNKMQTMRSRLKITGEWSQLAENINQAAGEIVRSHFLDPSSMDRNVTGMTRHISGMPKHDSNTARVLGLPGRSTMFHE